MSRRKQPAQFKPVHFLVVLAVDACLLAGMIIPQQARLRNAQALLAEREQALVDIRVEYERESDNLEFMKTTAYKLRLGSEKYGWHYENDILIRDGGPDAAPRPTYNPPPTPAPTQDLNPTAEPEETEDPNG
ncbi:MAG: hypothetical protein FWE69_07240 [Clostridiales bacterium]|nr:hypothetical protein [Clostridiales bacterium]